MIYGYARVSTRGQMRDGNSLEEQEARLRSQGAQEVFADAYTGTKTDRPQFQKLMEVIQPGDTIIATKLDRISRSASQGIDLVENLLRKGVSVHILNMGLMDNTPTGKLIRSVMFAFAQFERDMIIERTAEGKAVARQREGYREGRKPVSVDMTLFKNLRKKQKDGEMTPSECWTALGLSKSSWYKLLKTIPE